MTQPQPRTHIYRVILTTIWLTIASGLVLLLVVALRKVIFLVVVATFVALALNPAVRAITRWKIKRGVAVLIVVLAGLISAGAIGGLLAGSLAGEGVRFAQQAPKYLQESVNGKGPVFALARRLNLEGELRKAGPAMSDAVSKLPVELVRLLSSIASATASAVVIAVLSVFLLIEGPNIVSGVLRLLSREQRAPARRFGRSTSSIVSGYMTGVFGLAAINGLITAATLALLGVPFVVPLAIWAGLADVLPIVGGLLGIVPAALFAFAHSTSAGIIAVLVMLAFQQIKNHFLYPVIIGRAAKMNPLVVFLAVLVGAELGGIGGAILAIPIGGAIQSFAIEFVAPLRDGPDN